MFRSLTSVFFAPALSSVRTAQFSSSAKAFSSKKEVLQKIKELRLLTSAPVIDCKNALEETNGDIEVAKKNLIKRGLAQMEKQAGRIAEQGSVFVVGGYEYAAIVEMNCQTDFVSSNDSFKNVLSSCANALLSQAGKESGVWASQLSGNSPSSLLNADLDWLKTIKLEGDETIGETIVGLNYTTGEKVEIRRASLVHSPLSTFGSYSHQGRIGSVVAVTPTGLEEAQSEKINKFARNLAVHITGFRPSAIGSLSPSSAPPPPTDDTPYQDAETLGEVVPDTLMLQPFTIQGGGNVGQNITKSIKELNLSSLSVSSYVWWQLGGDETVDGF